MVWYFTSVCDDEEYSKVKVDEVMDSTEGDLPLEKKFTPFMYFWLKKSVGLVREAFISIQTEHPSHWIICLYLDLRKVPAKYVLFDLILWYIVKTIPALLE